MKDGVINIVLLLILILLIVVNQKDTDDRLKGLEDRMQKVEQVQWDHHHRQAFDPTRAWD